jgi:anti-sigma factor RsiW
MSNFEAREHLSAYLDGELSGEELTRMEAALEQDADLRADLDELREVVDELGELPELEAPKGLLAAVLADVAPLPIPGLADAAARSGEMAAAPAPRVVQPPPAATAPSLIDNVVRLFQVPWWLKGPAVAGLAAAIVVVVVLRQDPTVAPAPPSLADLGMTEAAESAPVPSGVVADADLSAGDAVADLGFDALTGAEEERRAPAAEPMMAEPTPVVMTGATSPEPPPASAPSRRAVPESVVGPEGVYETEWERDGEMAVASADPEPDDDELESDSAPRRYDEPSPGFAPDEATVADASDRRAELDEDAGVDFADTTMDDEPLEDFVDPPADDDLVASGRMASRETGSTSSGPPAGAGGPVSLDEVTFTGVAAQATLTVADREAATSLVSTLRSRGYAATLQRDHGDRLVVSIVGREDQRDALLRLLRERGSLRLNQTITPANGNVGITLTIGW